MRHYFKNQNARRFCEVSACRCFLHDSYDRLGESENRLNINILSCFQILIERELHDRNFPKWDVNKNDETPEITLHFRVHVFNEMQLSGTTSSCEWLWLVLMNHVLWWAYSAWLLTSIVKLFRISVVPFVFGRVHVHDWPFCMYGMAVRVQVGFPDRIWVWIRILVQFSRLSWNPDFRAGVSWFRGTAQN